MITHFNIERKQKMFEATLHAGERGMFTYTVCGTQIQKRYLAELVTPYLNCDTRQFGWGSPTPETTLLATGLLMVAGRVVSPTEHISHIVEWFVKPRREALTQQLTKLYRRDSHRLLIDAVMCQEYGKQYCSLLIPSRL
jgi:hypothetical protein